MARNAFSFNVGADTEPANDPLAGDSAADADFGRAANDDDDDKVDDDGEGISIDAAAVVMDDGTEPAAVAVEEGPGSTAEAVGTVCTVFIAAASARLLRS